MAGYSLSFRRAGPVAGPRARPEAQVFAEAERGLTEAAAFLQSRVVPKTPRGATSFLRGSIFSEVRGATLESLRGVVGTPAKYADVVELGRRAGRAAPPSGVGSGLWLWVVRRLRLSGQEARRAAYVIARAIGKRGIEGKFMFRDALKESQGAIKRRMEELGFRVARKLNGG